MAPPIKTVALAGCTGNVGAPTLRALLMNNFKVTVLSRKATVSVPMGVTVKQVDYSDRASLTSALQGIDAVVDATSAMDNETPNNLIEAAAAAGVYRFMPSSFGLDTEQKAISGLPVFRNKVAAIELLKRKAAEGTLTWTALACGGFLDWTLGNGFAGLDLKDRKIKLFDDGSNVLPWTTLEWTGRAAAEALLKADETKNRLVYVSNVVKSQADFVDLAKQTLGADGWTEVPALNMNKLLQDAMAELQKGNFEFQVFADMIRYAISHPDYGNAWKKANDNKLLGIKQIDDDEVKDLIKKISNDKSRNPVFF